MGFSSPSGSSVGYVASDEKREEELTQPASSQDQLQQRKGREGKIGERERVRKEVERVRKKRRVCLQGLRGREWRRETSSKKGRR